MSSATVSPPSSGSNTRQDDLIAGFLVFLIALPLCLGIAMASGFPPISGVLTAVVGGIVASFLGSAPLTIKGPAAGMIVIVLGAVTELGGGDMAVGYKRALAVGVVAGVVQVVLALVKAGNLGDLMPPSVVHGMLAAIGVIIISKQAHTVLGVTPTGKGPIPLLAEIPHSIGALNPEVFFIGLVALAILFGLPKLPFAFVKKVPAPMVVLAVAIPLDIFFDLGHEHIYSLAGHEYHVGPGNLIRLPGSLLDALAFPDFSMIFSMTSVKYVVMFALVGTIESMLSVSAVDAMDPARRHSDLNKDLLSTGVSNTVAAMIGGLPMISEIVRSRANIDAGARTRMSNFWHGTFLLASVAFLPMVLTKIPLAALGAMLVVVGTRLASPKEFASAFKVGPEQLAIFLTTFLITLFEDLLLGVAAGIVLKMVFHVARGVPLKMFFTAPIDSRIDGDTMTLTVKGAAIFTNYLGLKARLHNVPAGVTQVILDFGNAHVVDHTTLERLHHIQNEWHDKELVIVGLDEHKASSAHALSARRRTA